MDQALNQKIDAYIAENKEQLLQDIAALVAIDSVEGTPEEGAPFGAGPRAALDKTLELAAGMGLATRNCENYIGYAELAGADPEKYLATICHVDVVPVGNGWSQDPFKMQIRDGWMIGRGVADDKGPMVATLYALKFLKEEGVSLRYPIRAMVGDNEETHMNDVEYYLKNYPAPVFCFTPDAEFPVCNGEKGHFGAELVSPVCNGEIKELRAALPTTQSPTAQRTGGDRYHQAEKCPQHHAGAGRQWGAYPGLGQERPCRHARGHGQRHRSGGELPAGQRPVQRCRARLSGSPEKAARFHRRHRPGHRLRRRPLRPPDHHRRPHLHAGGPDRPDHGQPLPHLHHAEKMKEQIKAAIGTGASLEKAEGAEPFYIAADTPAIKACIETYNEVTGENATPFTMGGGTYARHFPYAVSFGPEHEDMVLPEFGGPMHGANEAAPIDKLLEALKIYIIALLRLEEIDF